MEVLAGIGPLNEFLRELHGPTDNVARTMGRLIPFPTQVGSLEDADLLDLWLSVATDTRAHQRAASVRAQARYATSARISQVTDFYLAALSDAGAVVAAPTVGADRETTIEAILPDQAQTQYTVSISADRGYRSVRVSAEYGGFDHRELFDQFARWHGGDAPVHEMTEPTGIEITTFTSGRGPETLVLYSTHYGADISLAEQRSLVDGRLNELGWTYVEPREGIMFIRDSVFDAETHVLGDDRTSTVTFVGEFPLR